MYKAQVARVSSLLLRAAGRQEYLLPGKREGVDLQETTFIYCPEEARECPVGVQVPPCRRAGGPGMARKSAACEHGTLFSASDCKTCSRRGVLYDGAVETTPTTCGMHKSWHTSADKAPSAFPPAMHDGDAGGMHRRPVAVLDFASL